MHDGAKGDRRETEALRAAGGCVAEVRTMSWVTTENHPPGSISASGSFEGEPPGEISLGSVCSRRSHVSLSSGKKGTESPAYRPTGRGGIPTQADIRCRNGKIGREI